MEKEKFKTITLKQDTRFTRLKVIKEIEVLRNNQEIECLCDCGNTKLVTYYNLKKGLTRSCRCLQRDITSKIFKGNPSHLRKPLGEEAKHTLFSVYRYKASSRGIEFILLEEDFYRLTSLNCSYCNIAPSNLQKARHNQGDYKYNGLDRVETSGKYEISNVVSCCKQCNQAKLTRSVRDFASWIIKIANYKTNYSINNEEILKYNYINSLRQVHNTLLPDWFRSMNVVFGTYKKIAKKRNLSFNLTKSFFRFITQQNCYYCGNSPTITNCVNLSKITEGVGEYTYNGIDRVDNLQGYEIENCVPCCRDCNLAKSIYTIEEFKSWIIRVYSYFIIHKGGQI